MATPQVTPEFLERAYNRLRRPSWEGGIDEALAHPLRGPIIRSLARDLMIRPTLPPEERPSRYAYKAPTKPVNQRVILDRKRLASGERDDD